MKEDCEERGTDPNADLGREAETMRLMSGCEFVIQILDCFWQVSFNELLRIRVQSTVLCVKTVSQSSHKPQMLHTQADPSTGKQ